MSAVEFAKFANHQINYATMETCELLEIKPVIDTRGDDGIIEERIDVGFGKILVAKQGAALKPNSRQHCLVTFHDLGLNYASNFRAFFSYHRMVQVAAKMPVLHINAPGQEDDADELPDDYVYPSMDQLAEGVQTVCNYYGIQRIICIGVGLGANIMVRVAKNCPQMVDGLFLINPVPTSAGWMEWAYQKQNIYYLSTVCRYSTRNNTDVYQINPFPQCVMDYLVWHHFGTPAQERNSDLLNMYKSYFSSYRIRPKNLSMLIDSYLKRDDIGISRENGIDCSALVLCGNDSPYLNDSIAMNQRLRPELSTWMKLFDCGLPLDELPNKVSEALILFIQGLGLGLLACYKYK